MLNIKTYPCPDCGKQLIPKTTKSGQRYDHCTKCQKCFSISTGDGVRYTPVRCP
jgi:hypothetical protein